MDVDQKLEELSILIEEAKAVPLSASCMVNRAAVLREMERADAALAGYDAAIVSMTVSTIGTARRADPPTSAPSSPAWRIARRIRRRST